MKEIWLFYLHFSDKRTGFPKMNVVQMFCIHYRKMDLVLYLESGSPAAFCQEAPKHLLKTRSQDGVGPGSSVLSGRLPREVETSEESSGEKLAAFHSSRRLGWGVPPGFGLCRAPMATSSPACREPRSSLTHCAL